MNGTCVSFRMLPALAIVSMLMLPGCGSSIGGGDTAVAELPASDLSQDTIDSWTADLPADAIGSDDSAQDVPTADFSVIDAVAADVIDASDVPDTSDDPGPPPPDPALRLRAAGWMAGDLHTHTVHSDADDPVSVAVALAEYVQSASFLAFHPEYVGNPIDFIALTDHRTVTQNSDPDFHSDSVVLIPGEEFGGPGHAGIWGLSSVINHDPGGDGSNRDDYLAGAEAAHAQGALFSMNHPSLPNIPFAWDVRTHDAMEVWNTRWALQGTAYSPANLEKWEAANGPASPFFRRAVQVQDEAGSGQFLRFYEAQLSLGIHVALVGGSDRHLMFAEGFPSTWVKADSRDVVGVLDGIRARHTFVTRTPVSATVEMSLIVGGTTYQMGDQIPVPADGVEVSVSIRVTRAAGGRVRLVKGSQVASDEDLATAPLGQVAFESPVVGDDFTVMKNLTLLPGDWVYPVVHETLIPDGLDPALAAKVPAMALAASQYTEANYASVISALIDFIDQDVVLSPELCDPAIWVATDCQCMTADDNGMASFFIPDWIDRILNVLTEAGQTSEWSMGAVGSAVRCVAQH